MRDSKRSLSTSEDTRKIRKILNEEVRLGIDAHSDSETEEVDLQKELHPLSYYINNREEMIEQMFRIIKGAKLKKMLPPILKDTPLDELKADCLIHLLGMSTKRIHAILEGQEINSSSDSETQSDNSTSKKSKSIVNPIVIKQEGCSDISDNSEEIVLVEPDLEFLNTASSKSAKNILEGGKKSKRCHIKNKKRKLEENSKCKRMAQQSVKNHSEIEQNVESSKSSSDNEITDEVEVPTEGKTLLEILELEMRARAIRALLQKSNTPDSEMVEEPTQSTSKSAIEKAISIKNIGKKKKKSDDVIVIAPKLVTIDLTDESDPSIEKCISMVEEKELGYLPKNNEGKPLNQVQALNKSPQMKEHLAEIISDSETDTKVACSMRKEIQSHKPSPQSIDLCKNYSVQESSEKVGQPKNNWAQRWLESKEVKKVVSTSKIYGNIRKKFKNAKLAKKNLGNSNNSEKESQEIQGSVIEYQSLPKSSKIPDLIASVSDSNNPEVKPSVGTETIIEMHIRRKEINSVEQVQDVSSTETPPENSICLTKPEALYPAVADCNATDTNHKFVESNVCDLLVQNINPCELKENLVNSKDETNEVEVFGTYSKPKICETSQSNTNCYESETCKDDTQDKNTVCSFTKENSTTCTSNSDYAQPINKVVVKSNSISNSKTDTCRLDVVDNNSSTTICKSELSNIFGVKEELKTFSRDSTDDPQLKVDQPDAEYIKSQSSTSRGIKNIKTKIDGAQVSVNSVLNISVSESIPNLDEIDNSETSICELVIGENKNTIFTDNSKTINENSVKGKSQTHEPFNNEPETLEINITDEDREIDEMVDEKID